MNDAFLSAYDHMSRYRRQAWAYADWSFMRACYHWTDRCGVYRGNR